MNRPKWNKEEIHEYVGRVKSMLRVLPRQFYFGLETDVREIENISNLKFVINDSLPYEMPIVDGGLCIIRAISYLSSSF